MSVEETQALISLEKDDSVIMKPSDKGENLVLLNHEKYTGMCYQLLNHKNNYVILKEDPTRMFKEELESVVVDALDRGLIFCRDECRFILIEHPRVATFYTTESPQGTDSSSWQTHRLWVGLPLSKC